MWSLFKTLWQVLLTANKKQQIEEGMQQKAFERFKDDNSTSFEMT